MAIAVIPHRFVHDLLPAAQILRFLGLEGAAFLGFRSAGLPPLEPGGAEGVHEEVEQAGEAHAHDRIPGAALAVALHLEAVVQQAGHSQAAGGEGLFLSLVILGVDPVQVDLGQVAVEVGAEDLAAGVEAVATEAVLQLCCADLGVVGGEPAAGFLAALIAIDLDEFGAQFRRAEQISVGAGDRFRSELDGALTGVELLSYRLEHRGAIGARVEHTGVIGHPQRIALGIDAPVAVAVLLPEVLLGAGGGEILGGELAHAGTAADVAGHDRHGGLVDQQAALHRGELPALGLAQDLGHPAVEILQLHRVGHTAETLQRFAHRTHVGQVHADLDRRAGVEALITAELEQQLVAVHPAAAGVAHLDEHLLAVDAVAGVLLALAGRSGADITHRLDGQLVAHHRQPADQVRLNDGAGAAAHHRQVHHQTEGLPVHQVGGGAVVGAGEVLALLNPGGAADPQPASGGEGFLFELHAAHQLHFLRTEVAQLAQAFEVAFGHLVPAFTAVGGLARIGAIEDGVGGRRRGWKVRSGSLEGLAHGGGAESRY